MTIQRGLGTDQDRLSPDITLLQHVEDVSRELSRLPDQGTLVGHSYPLMIISSVVETNPTRIQQLVFLDVKAQVTPCILSAHALPCLALLSSLYLELPALIFCYDQRLLLSLSRGIHESAKFSANCRRGLCRSGVLTIASSLCRRARHRRVADVRGHHESGSAQAQRSDSHLATSGADSRHAVPEDACEQI